jgi:hypothetical protein
MPSGFSISNGSFTYTSAAADVGKSLVIDWIAFRPFNDPAGSYSNHWAGLGSTVPNAATGSLTGPPTARRTTCGQDADGVGPNRCPQTRRAAERHEGAQLKERWPHREEQSSMSAHIRSRSERAGSRPFPPRP